MGYSRRGHKGKVDGNHAEIIKALRQAGCTAHSTASVGEGFPDICVGVAGHNLLLEVKLPHGRHTTDELEFTTLWRGQVATVRSAEEALAYLSGFRSVASEGFQQAFEYVKRLREGLDNGAVQK